MHDVALHPAVAAKIVDVELFVAYIPKFNHILKPNTASKQVKAKLKAKQTVGGRK